MLDYALLVHPCASWCILSFFFSFAFCILQLIKDAQVEKELLLSNLEMRSVNISDQSWSLLKGRWNWWNSFVEDLARFSKPHWLMQSENIVLTSSSQEIFIYDHFFMCVNYVSDSLAALSLKGRSSLCRRERRRRRAAPNPSVAWCSSAFAGWYRRLYLDSHLPTRPESRRLCRPPSHCGRSLRPCVQSLSQWRQSSQRRHAQKFPIHQGRRRIRHGALSGWHQGALPGDSGSFRHHCQSIPKPGQGRRLCDPQPSAWGPDHPVHGPKAGQMSKVSKGCNFGHRGYGVSSGIQFFLRLEATKALSLSFGHDDCTTDTANNRATTTSGNTTSAKNKPPTANSKRRNKNDRIGRIELNNQIFGLVWILVGFLLNCFELLWIVLNCFEAGLQHATEKRGLC